MFTSLIPVWLVYSSLDIYEEYCITSVTWSTIMLTWMWWASSPLPSSRAKIEKKMNLKFINITASSQGDNKLPNFIWCFCLEQANYKEYGIQWNIHSTQTKNNGWSKDNVRQKIGTWPAKCLLTGHIVIDKSDVVGHAIFIPGSKGTSLLKWFLHFCD